MFLIETFVFQMVQKPGEYEGGQPSSRLPPSRQFLSTSERISTNSTLQTPVTDAARPL